MTIESSLSPSLQRLVSTLSKLGLTGKEIAEAIWLASQTEDSEADVFDVPVVEATETTTTQEATDLPPLDSDLGGDVSPPEGQADLVPAPVEQTPTLALPENYKPIPVPDAPAISQALQLARALRPLARQIAVGLPTLLDEAATVDRIAETGVWQPVLKRESELWLDVALVFDTSPSMCLWQRFGADLHRLLSRYGEFRDVRVWQLKHTAGRVSLTARNGIVHKPSELLMGDRRRLIVVVSDCVAAAWHNGNMQKLIATWSAKLPTVVFQVFPNRLWSRTALARSVTVELQGKRPGLPSDHLQPIARSVWDRERLEASLTQDPVRLPVVTLEPDVVSGWARLVAGDRRSRVLGIVWDALPADQSSSMQSSTESTSALKERIDLFFLMAAPTSRDLAGLLASAPVITLPIARLIKQSMLPKSSAVHMAEVFMSGLLKVSDDQVPTFENAEEVAYELVNEEVRDRLRAGSLVVNALDVFQQVSNYVAQGLGKSVSEFWALLRTPALGTNSEETAFLNAFATVTANILRGLGGEFAAIANTLAPPATTESQDTTEEIDDFPLEDLEYEVAILIDFPPLQPCDYQSATITAILDRFDFQTAKIQRIAAAISWNQRRLQAFQRALQGSFQRVADLEVLMIDPVLRRRMPRSESLSKVISDLLQWAKDYQRLDELFEAFYRVNPNHPFVVELRQSSLSRWQINSALGIAWGYTERLTTKDQEPIDLDMIAIPAGSFTMGAPQREPESTDDERPQHEVTLQSFYLGRYPVTQAQWRVVAGYDTIEKDLDPDPSRFKGDLRPVENVSWEDAQEFCQRLSAKTGKLYCLPSEAQWEYACRAGTTTPFHFGETITTEMANYRGTDWKEMGWSGSYGDGPKGEYREETTDAGSFPANEWGLHDMHGNVWEWCEDDWHGSYADKPEALKQDGNTPWKSAESQSSKMLRGGSWNNIPRNCRSADRVNDARDVRFNGLGFRVCCVPPRTSS